MVDLAEISSRVNSLGLHVPDDRTCVALAAWMNSSRHSPFPLTGTIVSLGFKRHEPGDRSITDGETSGGCVDTQGDQSIICGNKRRERIPSATDLNCRSDGAFHRLPLHADDGEALRRDRRYFRSPTVG